MPTAVACLIYVGAIVAANLSVAALGPWVSPINSFVLIGLDLSLRDKLHDAWAGHPLFVWRMGSLILVAGAVSYAINPAALQIALASFIAFTVAGMVDAIAYHLMRKRPYLERVNGSNTFGAAADSILFPTIAFGVFLPHIVALQFVAKVGGGFLWSLALRRAMVRA